MIVAYLVITLGVLGILQPVTCKPADTPIYRQLNFQLPREKITKRSITRDTGIPLPGQETITFTDDEDDFHRADSGLVFRPLFAYRRQNLLRRRFVRSVDEDGSLKEGLNQATGRSIEGATLDDLEGAEGGLVFVPSFRHNSRRFRRSTEENLGTNDNKEDLEGAESSLVFLPSFRRNSRRFRRSTEENLATNDNKEDLEGAESSLVFIPSFRRNSRRFRRSTEVNTATNDKEDMVGAESGLVFLPSFRRNSRRFRRHADESYVTNDNEDEMETAANGMVFLPAFRRRHLRRERSVSDVTNSDDDIETADSSIVFRPLFRSRGFRRF